MKYTINSIDSDVNNRKVAIKCPHCGHLGTFEDVAQDISDRETKIYFGLKRCPNWECRGHLFFIMKEQGEVLITYPSTSIPFESTSLPQNVLNSFEEAIKCHAGNCFVACAIMIRKTLEELCIDKKAKGRNLFEKLEQLNSTIILPKEFAILMQELRLLGNDAAHIESQTFNIIGKEEVEISIEITKQILKAVYQLGELIQRIEKFKKQKLEIKQ